MNTFIELLKKYRFIAELSQEQLAKELGVAVMTIHRWEKGTHKPGEEERMRIEKHIWSSGVCIDPYELLTKEVKILQEKIDTFTDFLKRFHE